VQDFIKHIKKLAKADAKTIVFPEGTEPRILHATQHILKEKLANIILLGNEADINNICRELNIHIKKARIIDPNNYNKSEHYANAFYELRKHKGITIEQAREQMKVPIYLGTMLVHLNEADGLVSGSTHSTADTLRPALQIIKTHDKYHKVSSFFFMKLKQEILIFADCAVIINPNEEELAQIAIDSAFSAKQFGFQPRVAMLSFSTKGSANHELVDKVTNAVKIARNKQPDLLIDGEYQVDAALIPEVCDKKSKECKLQGRANVLIFPDLQSGNIAYKLVERLAKSKAIGPILQGLNKPINDLSRGCYIQDIIDVTAITVVEAQK
jgi:phosphate acetyltransferase